MASNWKNCSINIWNWIKKRDASQLGKYCWERLMRRMRLMRMMGKRLTWERKVLKLSE